MTQRLASAGACLLLAITVGPTVSAQERDSLSRPAFPFGEGPRILFDTAHWNPPPTEGRYGAVTDLLRSDGYRIVAGSVPFDANELSRYDVLFIVTPYVANPLTDAAGAAKPVFSEAESDISRCVGAGGRSLAVCGWTRAEWLGPCKPRTPIRRGLAQWHDHGPHTGQQLDRGECRVRRLSEVHGREWLARTARNPPWSR